MIRSAEMENTKSLHRVLDDGEVVLSKRGVIIGLLLLPVYLIGLSLAIEAVLYLIYMKTGYVLSSVYMNLIYYVIMLAIVLAVFGKYLWASLKRAINQKPRYIWIIMLYLGYLGILAFSMVSQVIVGIFTNDLTSTNQDAAVGFSQDSALIMGFMSCICAPIIEEVFFRGVLFRPFANNKVMTVIAAIVSALLFASIHVVLNAIVSGNYGELIYIVSYLPQGIIFAICCYKTKNICGSILMHLVCNAIALMVNG